MMGANWWQSPFFSPVRLPPRAARQERECICATEQLSPLFSPGGEAKCVRGPSVEGGGRSATLGTACRAPTFLNPALGTASKRNAVMAGLSCASTVSWWKNRVQPANSLQAKCFVSWLWRGANWWQSPFFAPARLLPRAASAYFHKFAIVYGSASRGPLPRGRGSESFVNQAFPGQTAGRTILRERPFYIRELMEASTSGRFRSPRLRPSRSLGG